MKDHTTEESRAYWNARSSSFARACGRGPYIDGFLDRLALGEGESVFDMGCGPGALALPLARASHPVLACDFSEGMLERLRTSAGEEGLDVATKLLAWEDDWDAAGIGPSSFGVAIASRSLPGGQVGKHIDKLERVAQDRVAVTVPAGPAAFADRRLLELLGRQPDGHRHDAEVIGFLEDAGKLPLVSYLPHRRGPRFPTRDMLEEDLRSMLGPAPLDEREENLLADFMAQHARQSEEDGSLVWHMDEPVVCQWALVIWRPDGGAIL